MSDTKPLPTKPASPRVGMVVLFNIGTLAKPVLRPADVVSLIDARPGVLGPINALVKIDGNLDWNSILERHVEAGLDRPHAATQANRICGACLWHRAGAVYGRDAGQWHHGDAYLDERTDLDAIAAASEEDRLRWAVDHPYAYPWPPSFLERAHAERFPKGSITIDGVEHAIASRPVDPAPPGPNSVEIETTPTEVIGPDGIRRDVDVPVDDASF